MDLAGTRSIPKAIHDLFLEIEATHWEMARLSVVYDLSVRIAEALICRFPTLSLDAQSMPLQSALREYGLALRRTDGRSAEIGRHSITDRSVYGLLVAIGDSLWTRQRAWVVETWFVDRIIAPKGIARSEVSYALDELLNELSHEIRLSFIKATKAKLASELRERADRLVRMANDLDQATVPAEVRRKLSSESELNATVNEEVSRAMLTIQLIDCDTSFWEEDDRLRQAGFTLKDHF